MTVRPGNPHPLGATVVEGGVNFALFSRHATAVELCLFRDPRDEAPSRTVRLEGRTGAVWHAWVEGAGPGCLYGYRAHGPWDPAAGHRFDPAGLLLDPYARVLGRPPALEAGEADAPVRVATAPLGMVVGPSAFDWGDDAPPRVPWTETVLYEAHVKGFTHRHGGIPPQERGTFPGMGSPAAVEHLRSLGATALQLLPVQQHATDRHLLRLGLPNYWGYNTLAFFAPDLRFVPGADPARALDSFKEMVRRLHLAGLEVLLDVVFNHTAEGDLLGPTLSLRGIDNASYYRLDPSDRSRYENLTGCGNTLDAREPYVVRLVLDALRWWVEEMRVDGFRFDLATVLARTGAGGAFDPRSPLLVALHQDPVLSRVKLIAEPWDLGPGGWQVGRFPEGWREWNGPFRDAVRRFWRGDEGVAGELALRIAGSPDLFGGSGRDATAGVHFAASHDGFTLADLVSHERKHNEANGEGNADGEENNLSCNHGVEGPTEDPEILALRERHRRNLLATVFLARGVPMLAAGDEMGRTQGGNNNAYCQDNETSWLDWSMDPVRGRFLAFARALLRLRRGHALLRAASFLEPGASLLLRDAEGRVLAPGHPTVAAARSLALGLRGEGGEELLLLCNAAAEPVRFRLDPGPSGGGYRVLLDTSLPGGVPSGREAETMGDVRETPPRSLVLLAGATRPPPP